jgi:hypothetical protein
MLSRLFNEEENLVNIADITAAVSKNNLAAWQHFAFLSHMN